MPHLLAITSDAPSNAGDSLPYRLTPSRLIPAFTSVNEAFALATEVTCFQRPEGTQRKKLLCKLHKQKDMQNHPWGAIFFPNTEKRYFRLASFCVAI
jgi:hypothetical protein